LFTDEPHGSTRGGEAEGKRQRGKRQRGERQKGRGRGGRGRGGEVEGREAERGRKRGRGEEVVELDGDIVEGYIRGGRGGEIEGVEVDLPQALFPGVQLPPPLMLLQLLPLSLPQLVHTSDSKLALSPDQFLDKEIFGLIVDETNLLVKRYAPNVKFISICMFLGQGNAYISLYPREITWLGNSTSV